MIIYYEDDKDLIRHLMTSWFLLKPSVLRDGEDGPPLTTGPDYVQ